MDGSFSNQTKLIKREIELAYEEVYGEEGARSSGMSDVDIKKLAGEIVGALKPEIEKLLVEYEARVDTAKTPASPTPTLASTMMHHRIIRHLFLMMKSFFQVRHSIS